MAVLSPQVHYEGMNGPSSVAVRGPSLTQLGPPLLRYLFARSAELDREILKRRETIFHGQDRLGIGHVNAWTVFERRQCSREYVHQS